MADVKLKNALGTEYTYTGIHKVTVPTTDGLTATFTDDGITPTGDIQLTLAGTTDVTNYATATILEAGLIPTNIKKDVSILGVIGSYGGAAKEEETFTVYPRNQVQEVYPTTGKIFSQGVVGTIYTDVMTASEMDANLVEANLGRMYRYVGGSTTDYKTNWLYVVSEEFTEPVVAENTVSNDRSYSAFQTDGILEIL